MSGRPVKPTTDEQLRVTMREANGLLKDFRVAMREMRELFDRSVAFRKELTGILNESVLSVSNDLRPEMQSYLADCARRLAEGASDKVMQEINGIVQRLRKLEARVEAKMAELDELGNILREAIRLTIGVPPTTPKDPRA